MRTGSALIAAAALTVTATTDLAAAGPAVRKPLDPAQRNAVLVLMHAVDHAQEADVTADNDHGFDWNGHILKAPNQTGYVPFRVHLKSIDVKSAALYVRAVSRHDGIRSKDERSALREWVERGGGAPPALQQTMRVSPGEMPVGGLGVSSNRQSISSAAESSTVLSLQQRQYEKEKAAQEPAQKKEEAGQRDPFRFPFEEYYFADVKSGAIDRALMLPAGEYDVFVALVDRSKLTTSSPIVVRSTIDVPNFWNDELRLSSVMLVKDVRQLKAPLADKDQIEHPYTFGIMDVIPLDTRTFTRDDSLSVLYQVCNYGAPDIDVQAEYVFYHDVGGRRTMFNRTEPQLLGDGDLPQIGRASC